MDNCGYYCVLYKFTDEPEGNGNVVGYSDETVLWFEEPPITFSYENEPDNHSKVILVLSGPYATFGEALANCINSATICGEESGSGSASVSVSVSHSYSESISYSYSYSYSPSTSPPVYACPYFSWGLVVLNTNDWELHNDRHLELRIQDAGASGSGSGGCGGYNTSRQSGTATSNVSIPAGLQMVIEWVMSATVEAQDGGFDYATFRVDGDLEALIESTGDQDGCTPYTPPFATGTTSIPPGDHTLEIVYDTVDELYHTSEFGVEFQITSCSLIPF